MTDIHDSHAIQAVTLDHACAAVLIVKGETPDQARVFYDLSVLINALLADAEYDRAMTEEYGNDQDLAIIAGKAMVLETLITTAISMQDQFNAQEELAGAMTVADMFPTA